MTETYAMLSLWQDIFPDLAALGLCIERVKNIQLRSQLITKKICATNAFVACKASLAVLV
jgi:hypothetical protein